MMKRKIDLIFAGLAFTVGAAAFAADTSYPDINLRPAPRVQPVLNGYRQGDELPFVEGQSAPAAPRGYAWCLEKRPPVLETVRQKVKIRDASWYYETVPPRYEVRTEQILVEPERKQAVLVAPARYENRPERRLVAPETSEYRTIPAQYQTVKERVVIAAAREEEELVEARYETFQERVMTQPERTVRELVPGCDVDSNKIECYAVRTIPAEYRTVTKTRLVEPARMARRNIPAQEQEIQVQKVITPARVETVTVPAKYDMIPREVLVEPAKYRYETIPAKYETVQKQVMVEPEGKRRVEVPDRFDEISSVKVIKPERLVWVLNAQDAVACDLPQTPAPAPAPTPVASKKGCSFNPFSRGGNDRVQSLTR
jgi:hypothetical protein